MLAGLKQFQTFLKAKLEISGMWKAKEIPLLYILGNGEKEGTFHELRAEKIYFYLNEVTKSHLFGEVHLPFCK